WAAGLHLAALALKDEDDPLQFIHEYSGAFGPVAEYLEHEMLLRQPPDVVKFLLQTSLLARLSADLSQAVSHRPDAVVVLDTLAKNNLFVVATNAETGEYRYHHLLADVLKRNLHHADSSLAVRAHHQAAAWYQAHDDLRSAIQHFVAAGAYDRA